MKRIIGIISVLALIFSVSGFAANPETAKKEVKPDKTVQTVTPKSAAMPAKGMKCKQNHKKPCCRKMADMMKNCPKEMKGKMDGQKPCCRKMADTMKNCPKEMKKPCPAKKAPAKPAVPKK